MIYFGLKDVYLHSKLDSKKGDEERGDCERLETGELSTFLFMSILTKPLPYKDVYMYHVSTWMHIGYYVTMTYKIILIYSFF